MCAWGCFDISQAITNEEHKRMRVQRPLKSSIMTQLKTQPCTEVWDNFTEGIRAKIPRAWKWRNQTHTSSNSIIWALSPRLLLNLINSDKCFGLLIKEENGKPFISKRMAWLYSSANVTKTVQAEVCTFFSCENIFFYFTLICRGNYVQTISKLTLLESKHESFSHSNAGKVILVNPQMFTQAIAFCQC